MSSYLGHFVQCSSQCDLPNFLLDHVIGGKESELENVRNPAAMRIHAVDTIKAIIAADEFQAGPLKALLDVHPVWSEFRDQSHDLFITDVEKMDPFLIQDSTDNAILGLLTDGSATDGMDSAFTSVGRVVNVMGCADTFDSPSPKSEVRPAVERGPTPPVLSAAVAGQNPSSAPVSTPAAQPLPASGPGGQRAKPLPVAKPPAAPTPVSTMARGIKSDGSIYNVTIVKGIDGLGLDIGKVASGGCMIRKLKDIPGNRPNPAASCVPAITCGDLIIGINGKKVSGFGEVVTVIKGLGNGPVQLTIERPSTSI